MERTNYIRFDWAIKRLLRQKANFVILEGFLSTVLQEDIRIERILDSESNKENADDKFNRVDMLAENSAGELLIIEVQNNRELDYFHRILYGTSKVITEYIHEGNEYAKVKKVYSINIVYFELGQGKDYVYHGRTEFRGIHENDILQLSASQQKQFACKEVGDVYPEYYVLRVEDFNKVATSQLDEWILFLKTSEISETATAKGLSEARERLSVDKMSASERSTYRKHMEALRYQQSVIYTGIFEGREEGLKEGREEGIKEGREEGIKEGREKGAEERKKLQKTIDIQGSIIANAVENLVKQGFSPQQIAQIMQLDLEEIKKYIDNNYS
jgi:predicted transposase/invertase (TIGR01784 family)